MNNFLATYCNDLNCTTSVVFASYAIFTPPL